MKKTIVITGAGSGIGRDAAVVLAERGHHVIATTETDAQAELLQQDMRERGLSMNIWKLDVTSPVDREKISTYDIDVLINNAAIGETGSLAEVPMDRVRQSFEVNVFGAISLAQIALKRMMEKKTGRVLFVSSLAGKAAMPFLNPYSMTKFALSGGVSALRSEIHRVAPNVHISLIEPGAYATGFNQRMMAKKYEWMDHSSYFASIMPTLMQEESKRFALLEQGTTASIVRKIVKAVESNKPRARYVAPWYQGLGIFIFRLFGM